VNGTSGEQTQEMSVDEGGSLWWIAIIVVVIIVCLIGIGIAAWKYKQRKLYNFLFSAEDIK
jgi:flagellar basal body-associated protein FliL